MNFIGIYAVVRDKIDLDVLNLAYLIDIFKVPSLITKLFAKEEM